MSGICGICEPGREIGTSLLAPMLEALVLPGEMERDTLVARSTALGVARRWNFQSLASLPGIEVAADADLLDVVLLRQSISLPGVSAKSNAEMIALAYAQRGMDFLSLLGGAFSLALWDEKQQRL